MNEKDQEALDSAIDITEARKPWSRTRLSFTLPPGTPKPWGPQLPKTRPQHTPPCLLCDMRTRGLIPSLCLKEP